MDVNVLLLPAGISALPRTFFKCGKQKFTECFDSATSTLKKDE